MASSSPARWAVGSTLHPDMSVPASERQFSTYPKDPSARLDTESASPCGRGGEVGAADEYIELTHLGYFSNNGAAYYYNTFQNASYVNTFLAVHSEARKKGIPYQYYQLDSFFYPKQAGDKSGTDRWAPHRRDNGF